MVALVLAIGAALMLRVTAPVKVGPPHG